MAEDKKGFLMYADQREQFDQLTDEQAGRLIKHLFAYVNDENPQTEDIVTRISFTPIKSQLKRDLIKYEGKKKQWSDAGKASAEARKLKKEQNVKSVATDSTDVNNRSTESSVSVNVNVNDNVNVSVNGNTSLKEKIENYLIESFTWKKAVIRNFDALGVKLDTEQLNELIILFCNELEMVDDLHKADRDNKAHCSRWIKKYLKDGQRQQQNGTTTKKSRYERTLEHNMETARQLAEDKKRNS